MVHIQNFHNNKQTTLLRVLFCLTTRVHQDILQWVTEDGCVGIGVVEYQFLLQNTTRPSALEYWVALLPFRWWGYIFRCLYNNKSHPKQHCGGARVAAGAVWLAASWCYQCWPARGHSFKNFTCTLLFTSGQFLCQSVSISLCSFMYVCICL